MSSKVERQYFHMDNINFWRAQFPILKHKIHLGNCSQSPISNRVMTSIDDYLQTLYDDGMAWKLWLDKVSDAKLAFAKLINADVDEIAIATSVSSAMASFISGLDFSKRDKMVTTSLDFPSNHYIWMANQKRGLKLHCINHNESFEIALSDYREAIDSNTKAVAIAQVSYLNGFKQNICDIAKIAHEKGALCLVDAYQGLGTEPIDVKLGDIDMLVSGNLKYLLGLPGIAFMYVKRELALKLEPSVTGWMGQENPFNFQIQRHLIASGTRKFETGTPPILEAYAAEAGMKFIADVGVSSIKAKIDNLSEIALNACRDYKFDTISPKNIVNKGSNTALVFKNPEEAYLIERKLAESDIIVSARGNLIRIAPHFYNTEEEIIKTFESIISIREGLSCS